MPAAPSPVVGIAHETTGAQPSALPPAVQKALAAVVRIENDFAHGKSGGSGAHLGRRLVVTCDHLFRNRAGGAAVGRITVFFPGGHALPARLIRQDSVWDLALLELDGDPPAAAAIKLAADYPRRHARVVSVGYGSRGQLAANVGRVVGFGGNKQGRPGAADTLILTGTARNGDSGGPILNERGELAGVLWGSGSRTVVGTQVNRAVLSLFGGNHFGRRPTQPPTPPAAPLAPPAPQPASPHPDLSKYATREELARLRAEFEAALSRLGGKLESETAEIAEDQQSLLKRLREFATRAELLERYKAAREEGLSRAESAKTAALEGAKAYVRERIGERLTALSDRLGSKIESLRESPGGGGETSLPWGAVAALTGGGLGIGGLLGYVLKQRAADRLREIDHPLVQMLLARLGGQEEK